MNNNVVSACLKDIKKPETLINKELQVTVYSERDLNPHGHYCPLDFKSNVSTNSTIRAAISKTNPLQERV